MIIFKFANLHTTVKKEILCRPHKKNSWLASLAFAKKWAGRLFFKFILLFNALVLGPKLDFLAQYRYFFIFQNMIHTVIFARNTTYITTYIRAQKYYIY